MAFRPMAPIVHPEDGPPAGSESFFLNLKITSR
jgi:hypothetical protein